MSRRRQAVKRPLIEDPKYHSTLVTRLVNTVMIDGKKNTAERVVYSAFDQIVEATGAERRRVRSWRGRLHTLACCESGGCGTSNHYAASG